MGYPITSKYSYVLSDIINYHQIEVSLLLSFQRKKITPYKN